MPLPHSPRAPLNLSNLQPVGYCDRCNFLYHLAKLKEQRRWAGDHTVSTGLKVCPTCLDELQENGFRTIVIGPDPKPLKDPRPGWTKQQMGGGVKQQMVLDDPERDKLDEDYLG